VAGRIAIISYQLRVMTARLLQPVHAQSQIHTGLLAPDHGWPADLLSLEQHVSSCPLVAS
jgi:hypothetical protein